MFNDDTSCWKTCIPTLCNPLTISILYQEVSPTRWPTGRRGFGKNSPLTNSLSFLFGPPLWRVPSDSLIIAFNKFVAIWLDVFRGCYKIASLTLGVLCMWPYMFLYWSRFNFSFLNLRDWFQRSKFELTKQSRLAREVDFRDHVLRFVCFTLFLSPQLEQFRLVFPFCLVYLNLPAQKPFIWNSLFNPLWNRPVLNDLVDVVPLVKKKLFTCNLHTQLRSPVMRYIRN